MNINIKINLSTRQQNCKGLTKIYYCYSLRYVLRSPHIKWNINCKVLCSIRSSIIKNLFVHRKESFYNHTVYRWVYIFISSTNLQFRKSWSYYYVYFAPKGRGAQSFSVRTHPPYWTKQSQNTSAGLLTTNLLFYCPVNTQLKIARFQMKRMCHYFHINIINTYYKISHVP